MKNAIHTRLVLPVQSVNVTLKRGISLIDLQSFLSGTIFSSWKTPACNTDVVDYGIPLFVGNELVIHYNPSQKRV
ncbi:MAG: hypothetical protein JRF64_10220 [Deltaproteobacteria bacterium]|nr:hypothetical protein [Deltaproteobacteria bacterium]